MAFTCKVSPALALAPVCSLSPVQVQVTKGGQATSTLTVNTTPPTAFLARPANLGNLWRLGPNWSASMTGRRACEQFGAMLGRAHRYWCERRRVDGRICIGIGLARSWERRSVAKAGRTGLMIWV